MFAFVDVLAKVVPVAPDVDDGTIGVAVDNPSAFKIVSSSNEVLVSELWALLLLVLLLLSLLLPLLYSLLLSLKLVVIVKVVFVLPFPAVVAFFMVAVGIMIE